MLQATLLCLWLLSCNSEPDNRLSAASINILHGFDCDAALPGDGNQCRLRERVALLAQHLMAAGCPDIVTLQEVVNREFLQRSPQETVGPLDSVVELLEEELGNLQRNCGFRYHLIYEPFLETATAETDEELILSRYPVIETEIRPLYGPLFDQQAGLLLFVRHVLAVSVQHPLGRVWVFTTHLASGTDFAAERCGANVELIPGSGISTAVPCPPECKTTDSVRLCQVRQVTNFVNSLANDQEIVLLSGDFNAEPGSAEYQQVIAAGFRDSHLLAGNEECSLAAQSQCTSGRDAEAGELESPARNQSQRIDYIFIRPGDCRLAARRNGIRIASIEAGLFAANPNPFAGQCGAPPLPICWSSDHSGNLARLYCGF